MVCLETVAALDELARLARRGEVVGVTVITLGPSGTYRAVYAGSALLCPTFMVGALVRATFELDRVAEERRVG